MKQSAPRPVRKGVSAGRAAKRPRARPDEQRAGDQPRQTKTPSRSKAMRLAEEVDRLAAQLEQSRARITDLEAKVDIDPLTELLNRRSFERELKRSVAYVKRYGVGAALVYLDLDGLEPVNDRHGSAARDAVLKAVAAALLHNVRASDMVARVGDDEFVVLLWNVSGPAAVAKAAVLERAIYSTPMRWGASTLVVSAAAGVALIGALDQPSELLARAEGGMHARKSERLEAGGHLTQ